MLVEERRNFPMGWENSNDHSAAPALRKEPDSAALRFSRKFAGIFRSAGNCGSVAITASGLTASRNAASPEGPSCGALASQNVAAQFVGNVLR